MTDSFDVVARGLREGFEREQVLLHLQRHLRLSAAKAQHLLGEQPVVIKKALDRDTAHTYRSRLSALGIETILRPVTHDAPTSGIEHIPSLLPRPSFSYTTALWRASARSLTLVTIGFVLAMAATLLLTAHLWRFAYLLSAPPVLFSALIYLLPAIVLLALCLMLWRPWLSARDSSSPVSPESASQSLNALVETLSAACAVPAPTAMEFDTGTDIRVIPQAGLRHLNSGRYRLVIGLPLLQCLSQRDCAGLIAGALASRARPLALRCLSFNAVVRAHLEACVNDDDWLGARLTAYAASGPRRLAAVLRAFLQWPKPLFKRAAMFAVSSDAMLSAKLCAEADRYLLEVVGTDAFCSTLASVRDVERAHGEALRQNFADRQSDALIDDLPALVSFYYGNRAHSDFDFDADAERTANNDALDDAARLHRCGPAHRSGITLPAAGADNPLGVDSTSLTQHATRTFYQNSQEHRQRPLIPAARKIFDATEDLQRRRRARTYFNGWFIAQRFWALPDYALIRELPLRDAAEQLNVCVNEVRRLTPDRQQQLAACRRLQREIQEILLGQRVLAAGHAFPFRFPQDAKALPEALAQRQQQLALIIEQLDTQDSIMGGRLALGLRLCGQAAGDIEPLHRTLAALRPLDARLQKLDADTQLLEQLLHRRERGHAQTIAWLEARVDEACALLLQRFGKIDCPFNAKHRSLAHAIEARLPAGSIAQRARLLLREVWSINEWLALRAADCGVTAEAAYRIERINRIAAE